MLHENLHFQVIVLDDDWRRRERPGLGGIWLQVDSRIRWLNSRSRCRSSSRINRRSRWQWRDRCIRWRHLVHDHVFLVVLVLQAAAAAAGPSAKKNIGKRCPCEVVIFFLGGICELCCRLVRSCPAAAAATTTESRQNGRNYEKTRRDSIKLCFSPSDWRDSQDAAQEPAARRSSRRGRC